MLAVLCAVATAAKPTPAPPPVPPAGAKNVLHFVVDDLRPEMNVAYKQTHMKTPAFDRLAREGLVFDRAYCNIAVCAPSRNSFMAGVRPEVTGVFNFYNHIRQPGMPRITTLPQQFKNAGYVTLGGGKTFHYSLPPQWDDIGPHGSWSSELQPYFPFFEYPGAYDFAVCKDPANPDLCVVDGDEEAEIYDCRLKNHTIQTLRFAKSLSPRPFYIAAGFRRPHRVEKVFRTYWDMYSDQPASSWPLAKYKTRQPSQPHIAFHGGGVTVNGTKYGKGAPDVAWPDEVAQLFRKYYSVAVTQTDAYIGEVLDELDALDLTHNTLVVLHSDHGWQLGELGLWDKQTEFELATRVPLLMRAPWLANSVGKHTKVAVELVDLHPTLAALAGLNYTAPTQVPVWAESHALGRDVSAVFEDPSSDLNKTNAFSQWPVCTTNASKMCMACTGSLSSRARLQAMGYSIRTAEWRFTAWVPFNTTAYVADWSAPAPIAAELYDHRNDTGFDFDHNGEHINLAEDPKYADIKAELFAALKAQYTWPEAYLEGSIKRMHTGQLKYDADQGFYPYNGGVPVPPEDEEFAETD